MSTKIEAGQALRTFALMKQVPALHYDADLDEDRRLIRDPAETDINPWCRRALAHAIDLAGDTGTCTAITMGPPSARDALREAEACGAHRLVHLCDPGLAGSDCLRTARALSALLQHLTEDGLRSRDLVLVGRSTVDGSTAAVGMMVAEYLGVPFVGTALKLAVHDTDSGPRGHALLQNEGATETVEFALPAVVAVAERSILPARSPRETWPDGSRVTTLGLTHLGARFDASANSPTRVADVRPTPRSHRAARVLHAHEDWLRSLLDVVDAVPPGANEPDDTPPPDHTPPPDRSGRRILVVSSGQDPSGLRALVGEGRRLAALVGAEVVAVGPPQPEDERPDGWADVDGRVVLADAEPMAAAESITAWLGDDAAWAVLGTPIAWDREVLSRLAVRLDAGLLSDLTAVSVVAGDVPRLLGEKPAGSAFLAEVDTIAPTQIMTLRTGSLGAPTPSPRFAPLWTIYLPARGAPRVTRSGRLVANSFETLDRARVVIGVGQGIDPTDYPHLERLRAALGAELAATRKVTDRAWMDHDRQVGVTARHIAPDLYLALAISGNQHHLAGVAGARTIVAVNRDPQAAIFAGCDLGIVADWREVAVALVAHLGGH